MLLKLYDTNPNPAQIRHVAEVLRNGGIIIFPTDSVYAFGCNIFNHAGVEKITKIKNKDLRKADLSFICNSISQISEYARVDDETFRILKKNLPGPFTLILNGTNRLPKLFKNRKTVGVRMPKNNIALEIVRELGNPMMTSSIFTDDETTEYITDPELIEEKYGDLVDIVIDGGFGGLIPSAIIDCTADEPVVVRKGEIEPEL